MRILLVAVLLCGVARAETVAKKLAALEEKKGERAAPARGKKVLEARLTRLVGKKPEPLINFRNVWTDETFAIAAKKDAKIDGGTLDQLLRCHYTNEHTHMDPRLFGVLVGAALRFTAKKPVMEVDIVSGFRSPKYNLMLRKKGHEVARDSQHTYGHAVDFRIPGVPTKVLLGYVQSLHLGGAGFYPESAFVHADTGPIRFWAGR